MVVTPHIFGQIKGESLTADPTLSCKSPFEVSPEPFQAVDMVFIAITVLTIKGGEQ